uniref:Uncharacterized protein n=1 Tax=Anguilla anguilla TaxID=7936 RepID=A0A0E9WSA5_ANGAN
MQLHRQKHTYIHTHTHTLLDSSLFPKVHTSGTLYAKNNRSCLSAFRSLSFYLCKCYNTPNALLYFKLKMRKLLFWVSHKNLYRYVCVYKKRPPCVL